jgi:hypothetical protein
MLSSLKLHTEYIQDIHDIDIQEISSLKFATSKLFKSQSMLQTSDAAHQGSFSTCVLGFFHVFEIHIADNSYIMVLSKFIQWY